MRQCQYPIYQETETIYIKTFGIERVGEEAFWGPGRRSECIVHYVLSGEGFFNGNPIHGNQGFYIEASELVEYYPNNVNPWNYFWIDCSQEFARRYLRPTIVMDDNGIFDYDFKGKLLTIIDKIFGCKHPMSTVESLGYAFSVLMLHPSSNAESASRPQHYVRQAKNYIDSSVNRKLTVRDVADAISIHDRYLYSLFLQYEGISPKEYILRRKVETATDLLENTPLSVMEIASAVGFPDVYSFSKLFKTKTGVAPTKYRNSVNR